MKFSMIALAAATTVSAGCIKRGDDLNTLYDVTEFQASCVPHSAQCNYSFKVKQHASMETNGVSCSATGVADAGNTLPAITGGTCVDSSRTWKIVKSTDGLALFVSQQISPASYSEGVHQINNSELEIVTSPNPNGNIQRYAGPADFPLDRPQYS